MTINFALTYIINFGYIFTVKFSSAIKTLDKFIFFGMSDLEHLCVGTYLTLLTKIALIIFSQTTAYPFHMSVVYYRMHPHGVWEIAFSQRVRSQSTFASSS